MADTKISALSAIGALAAEDLVAVVDDPSGTPVSNKATFTQVAALLDTLLAGQRTIWVPATAMMLDATTPPTLVVENSTTNNVINGYLSFADGASDVLAGFQIQMPKSWNEGTLVAQFVWKPSGTNTGNCVWGIQAVALADGNALDTAYGTAQTVTDAGQGTADLIHVTAETSAITVAGSPGAEELVFFRVYRDNDGSDTLTDAAELLGVKIHYTVDTLKDD